MNPNDKTLFVETPPLTFRNQAPNLLHGDGVRLSHLYVLRQISDARHEADVII